MECFLKLAVLVSFALLTCDATNGTTRAIARHKRAIGGQEFGLGRWPWLVLMKATVVTQRLFGFLPVAHYHKYCGGVLVSRRWVLSAAHCYEGSPADADVGNWKARLGTVRTRPSITQRFRDILGRILEQNHMRQWEMDIERIVKYPGYNISGTYAFYGDLALVKLSRDAPVTRHIRPIHLPSATLSGFPAVRQMCVTKGWGCTSSGGTVSPRAHEIRVPILSEERCNSYFHLPSWARDQRVCAGYRNRGVGICSGDSGSPLVCMSGSEFTLAGIVSAGSKRKSESYPGIFVRVQPFLSWIQRVIHDN